MKELSIERMQITNGGGCHWTTWAGGALALGGFALAIACPPAGVLGFLAYDVAFGSVAIAAYQAGRCVQ